MQLLAVKQAQDTGKPSVPNIKVKLGQARKFRKGLESVNTCIICPDEIMFRTWSDSSVKYFNNITYLPILSFEEHLAILWAG
jgi:hypothetical protein